MSFRNVRQVLGFHKLRWTRSRVVLQELPRPQIRTKGWASSIVHRKASSELIPLSRRIRIRRRCRLLVDGLRRSVQEPRSVSVALFSIPKKPNLSFECFHLGSSLHPHSSPSFFSLSVNGWGQRAVYLLWRDFPYWKLSVFVDFILYITRIPLTSTHNDSKNRWKNTPKQQTRLHHVFVILFSTLCSSEQSDNLCSNSMNSLNSQYTL